MNELRLKLKNRINDLFNRLSFGTKQSPSTSTTSTSTSTTSTTTTTSTSTSTSTSPTTSTTTSTNLRTPSSLNLFTPMSSETIEIIKTFLSEIQSELVSQSDSIPVQIDTEDTKDNIHSYYERNNSKINKSLPLMAMTTTVDNNNQELDVKKIPNRSNILVPNEPGNKLIIDNVTIIRGTGIRQNQISIDNGATWLSYGSVIQIGKLKLTFMGAGSPLLFETSTINSPSQTVVAPSKPNNDSSSDDSSMVLFWIIIVFIILVPIIGGLVYYYIYKNKPNKINNIENNVENTTENYFKPGE